MDAKSIECIRSTASVKRFGARSSAQMTGFRSIEHCGANGPPSRTPIDRYALTWLAVDMCSPSRKKGNTRPRRGRTEFPTRDTFAPDDAKRLDIAHVAREKKKPPVLAN